MTIADWDNPSVRSGITRMLERRAAALDRGESAIGWKLAFGAPAALTRFGTTGPVVGYLTDATLFPPGATISCEGWGGPVAEPELAAYFGADVDDPMRARDAISGFGAAIELANVDPPPDDIGEVLAGNVYHQAVLFAEPKLGGETDLSALSATVVHAAAEPIAVDDLEAMTGRVDEIVTHAAGLLAAAGEKFREGDVVILGSVTPPLRIAPGQEVVFTLAGQPPLQVKV